MTYKSCFLVPGFVLITSSWSDSYPYFIVAKPDRSRLAEQVLPVVDVVLGEVDAVCVVVLQGPGRGAG